MVANTGTYVDAPFHRFADGIDLAGLPLWNLAGRPGIVVDPPLDQGPAIEAVSFHGLDLSERAVLVRTGWDRHLNTPAYGEGHPFLTRAAAEYLVEAGAAIVGIDSLNIDDTSDPQRPSIRCCWATASRSASTSATWPSCPPGASASTPPP